MGKTLILIFMSLNAWSNTALIDYFYGNSKKGSYITIFQNGEIELKERTCCPIKVKHRFGSTLDEFELKELKERIHQSRLGPFVHHRVRRVSKFGHIKANLESSKIYIREKETDGGWLVKNESFAAKELMKFLHSLGPELKWKHATKAKKSRPNS
ncbi:MAG: hypothetical protein KC478_03895 [Bacteriovoracaceae bacterium]|nr:hypothetical protein [Bacteriovoracaceae bacterium]